MYTFFLYVTVTGSSKMIFLVLVLVSVFLILVCTGFPPVLASLAFLAFWVFWSRAAVAFLVQGKDSLQVLVQVSARLCRRSMSASSEPRNVSVSMLRYRTVYSISTIWPILAPPWTPWRCTASPNASCCQLDGITAAKEPANKDSNRFRN